MFCRDEFEKIIKIDEIQDICGDKDMYRSAMSAWRLPLPECRGQKPRIKQLHLRPSGRTAPNNGGARAGSGAATVGLSEAR